VQIGPLRPDTAGAADVPAALAAAARLGHRPAITVLFPGTRQEQSYASLAQWAAKGAHFFDLELDLGPGDRVRIDAPAGWPAAAVALGAWWAGLTVVVDDGEADVAVAHQARPRPDVTEVLWVGDGFDGAPVGASPGEAWVRAVQTFPDQAPPTRATPDLVAVSTAAGERTHRDLVADLADEEGVLGFAAEGGDPLRALVDTAVRPLLTGRPTVVLRGVGRADATGEQVTVWR
jgi:uncharacterized protein (TIGR03089 family)